MNIKQTKHKLSVTRVARNTPLALMLGMLGACTGHQEKKPNFLILISDDQRWDQLSCADHPIIPELRTPNMDRLAKNGVYFQNAFVTSPICSVSRACIMTGRYESSHGMNHFNTPLAPDVLQKTYPAVLHENGYRTGVLGKWGMGTEGTDRIFDVFNAWANQGAYFHKTDTGRIHNSEWLAIEARKFLESSADGKPFCLTVCFKSPHHPYQPDPRDTALFDDVVIPKRKTDTPEDYRKMAAHVMDSSLNRWCYFDERRDEPTKDKFEKNFLRCVASLDRSVGEILQALKDQKLDKNTVIIYLSDNGYLWGEHGLGGKWLLYEESIRVPIIISDPREPGRLHGLRPGEFALNIDVAPTVLDLAGVPVPPEMNGISLAPWIQGKKLPTRNEFFLEHVGVIEVETPIPDSRGIRTTDWKYIHYINTQPEVDELYHISVDPFEENNLAGNPEYSGILERMKGQEQTYLQELVRPL
jgi:arylsulfatase A-like enzyme